MNAEFEREQSGAGHLNHDLRAVMLNGEVRYLTGRGEVIMKADGTPEKTIGVNYDNTNEIMAKHTTTAAEQRLRSVIDKSVTFIGVLAPDETSREANEPALLAGEVVRSDVAGQRFWNTYWWHMMTRMMRA